MTQHATLKQSAQKRVQDWHSGTIGLLERRVGTLMEAFDGISSNSGCDRGNSSKRGVLMNLIVSIVILQYSPTDLRLK